MVQLSRKATALVMALVCAVTMSITMIGTTDVAEAKSIQTKIWDYLVLEAGCSPAAAAGIMGNIQQESNFRPRAGTVSKGLFQLSSWHMGRIRKLAKKRGTKWYNTKTQMVYATKYMSKEIRMYSKYNWKKFRKFKSPAKAARVWEKSVERAGAPMMGKRIKYANKFYKKYKKRTAKKLRAAKQQKQKKAIAATKTNVTIAPTNHKTIKIQAEESQAESNEPIATQEVISDKNGATATEDDIGGTR